MTALPCPLERARALLESTGDQLRHILHDMPEADSDGRDYIQQAIDMTSDARIQIGNEATRREEEEHAQEIARQEREEAEYERSVRSLVGQV